MARNSEVIRQWEVLRAIDAAQTGIPIAKLAEDREVHQRTIRRDIEALCRAGFPLYDEKVNGTTMWKVQARPFRALQESGLGLTELAALYFSRSILSALAGPVLQDDVDRALLKIEKALPSSCRAFLNRLPRCLSAKSSGRKKVDERKLREIIARALDAIIRLRRVTMRYASASSRRTKEYLVEPQRIAYADRGIYLTAWVVEYSELRTFALERVETLAVCDDAFQLRPLPLEPFPNSLGVHTGPTEHIEIEFDAEAADYVRAREWHKSQQLEERQDGSVVLSFDVCNDLPLRSWILGFGSRARVIAPAGLALEMAIEHERAAARYERRSERRTA